jgi:hypothetical protein
MPLAERDPQALNTVNLWLRVICVGGISQMNQLRSTTCSVRSVSMFFLCVMQPFEQNMWNLQKMGRWAFIHLHHFLPTDFMVISIAFSESWVPVDLITASTDFFYYCNTSHRFITTIFAQTLVTQYHLDIPRQDPVWEAHPQPHVNGPKWWTFQNGYGWFHTITIIWLYMYNLICMLPHIYIMIYYHVIQELATCEPSSWRFN